MCDVPLSTNLRSIGTAFSCHNCRRCDVFASTLEHSLVGRSRRVTIDLMASSMHDSTSRAKLLMGFSSTMVAHLFCVRAAYAAGISFLLHWASH